MPVNLAYRAYQLLWEASDWLYPPSCGGCGAWGERWCAICTQLTPEITFSTCPICGNPNSSGEICQRCSSARPLFTALRSYAVFTGPVREAIHELKYKHNLGIGEALSRLMIANLHKLNWSLDLVTSVPLGLARFRERGYNQATLLARPIALSIGLPYSGKIIKRIKETKSQVDLSYNERQENMAEAFKAHREIARGKSVLVIDDVATSGATLNACAKALLEAGATRVYGYTLARAVFHPDGNIGS